MQRMGGRIAEIEEGSPAFRAGLRPGDEIESVNGIMVRDMLDFMFHSGVRNPSVTYYRDGLERTVRVRKGESQAFGITFEGLVFDRVRPCANKCEFCFVDQDPRDARSTMQIKDDDYRLSMLSGNFITLTNLAEEDWAKIETMRISPLYVSVHATEPDVRVSLMRNPRAAGIMDDLKRLASIGVSIHAQVVLCPGINDGPHLERTLSDLASLYPSVESVALVPVGLTKHHRPNRVRSFSVDEMERVLETAFSFSNEFVREHNDVFVYPADEFFIKTGTEIPPLGYYGEFPQLENGIGMTRLFLTGMNRSKRFVPKSIASPRRISLITGKLAFPFIERAAALFEGTGNLELKVHAAESVFWGPDVDVAGLLTGTDVVNEIVAGDAFEEVVIPYHCLRDGRLFLDGMTVGDVERKTGRRLVPVAPDFGALRREICKKAR